MPHTLLALHRYFLWAYRMRAHHAELGKRPEGGFEMQRWKVSSFQYGGLWLALLYVVVEGWKELKLVDPVVDELLCSEHVDSLRRIRNALFHFQVEYADDRVMVFLSDDPVPVQWAIKLHSAFDQWFRVQINLHRIQ